MFAVNENYKFYPLRMAKRDPQNTIDLFLYEEDGKCHYSLTKNLSRLFRSQITSRTNGTIHICKKCFTHFSKGELFQKHIEYCSSNETVAVKMPPRNSKLCFNNCHKQLPILYTKTNSTDDISAIFVSKLAKVIIFFLYVKDELRAVALSPINQLLLQPRTLRYTSLK